MQLKQLWKCTPSVPSKAPTLQAPTTTKYLKDFHTNDYMRFLLNTTLEEIVAFYSEKCQPFLKSTNYSMKIVSFKGLENFKEEAS